MPTQLQNLRSKVRSRLGRASTDGFLTDSKLTTMVNEALQSYSVEGDWEFLEAVETIATSATQTYTPNSNSRGTIALHDWDGDPLKRVPINELLMMGDAASDYVRLFANVSDIIYLFPTPNGSLGNLTHVYASTEPELSGDTDTPLLPTPYDPVVVNHVCYQACLAEGDLKGAAAFYDQYEKWVGRLPRSQRLSVSTGGGVPMEQSS